MASVFERLRGTLETLFQIGKGGPQIKNNAGALEARNPTDTGFVVTRGATPVGINDFVTKAYADAIQLSTNEYIGGAVAFTVPAGVSVLLVELVGGGGGGGGGRPGTLGGASARATGGGGGGAGKRVCATFLTAPGNSLLITPGPGGAGGASGAAGQRGRDSSIVDNTSGFTLYVPGGTGGDTGYLAATTTGLGGAESEATGSVRRVTGNGGAGGGSVLFVMNSALQPGGDALGGLSNLAYGSEGNTSAGGVAGPTGANSGAQFGGYGGGGGAAGAGYDEAGDSNPGGNGGFGGSGTAAGVGLVGGVGFAPNAGTAAGGGGGGGGGNGSTGGGAGGAGGAGANGLIRVSWIT